MAGFGQRLSGIRNWIPGAMILALLIGLPLAVAWRTTFDHGATAASRARNALIVTKPHVVSPSLKLSIVSGVLHNGNGQPIRANQPIDTLEAEGAAFTLDFSTTPAVTDATTPIASDLQHVLARIAALDIGKLVLRRSTIDIMRSDASRLRLTDVTGEVQSPARDSFVAKGTARLAGQVIIFDASWSRPTDPKRDNDYALKFALKGSLIDAKFNGKLRIDGGLRLAGSADVAARKVRAMARQMGLPIEGGLDLRRGSVAGDMTWADGLLAFPKATVSLDGNEATGVISLRTSGPRPKVEGTLAFKSFAMAPYIETLASGLGSTAPITKDGDQQALIKLVDADLRLSARKVAMPRLEVGRGAVTLSINNGRMLADVAEFEIEGGTIGGQITLDVSGSEPRLGIKARADGIDPGRVFADVLKRNPLLGRANITLDATGTGATLEAIKATLAGKGSFQMVESGRLGLDLKTLLHVSQKGEATGWSAAGRGNTSLSTLTARFHVSEGSVMFESITAQSGSTTYLGAGRADFLRQQLDLSIANGNATSSEVPVTAREAMRMHGPWEAPQFEPLPPLVNTTGTGLRGWLTRGSTLGATKAVSPAPIEPQRAMVGQ